MATATNSKLTPEQIGNATIITKEAEAAGLTPQQAFQLVGASYAESGLREGAVNKSSGAFGLFQLLSKGYVDTYNQAVKAGKNPAVANVDAILPAYKNYFNAHPNAPIGDAAAAVEASGQPASWYASSTYAVGSYLDAAHGNVTSDVDAAIKAAEAAARNIATTGAGAAQKAASGNALGAGTDVLGALLGKIGVQNPVTAVEQGLKSQAIRAAEVVGGAILVVLGLLMLGRSVGASGPASQVSGAVKVVAK